MQPVRPTFEFHIARAARQRYHFDETIFATNGNVLFADFSAAQRFAHKMSAEGRPARAGEIYAMGLIDEVLHRVARLYRMQVNPWALEKALAWLDERLGAENVERTLRQFCAEFPPMAVYHGEIGVDAYLAARSDGLPNRQIALEEMLMLWLANANPAFAPYDELFDDRSLSEGSAYREIIAQLEAFFETQPPFGPQKQPLFQVLRAPALAADTLEEQLAFIRQHWASLLGDWLDRLLQSLDFLREEHKPSFRPGPGPILAPQYTAADWETEVRFSPDHEWMPGLVLLAKNIYVWLHQLGREYGRKIQRLDQIPDEELDKLVRWGFNGLWLIGLWERSPASQRIKQLCGNPDAGASAYSLYDYVIAADLGGEAALRNLRQRAAQRGIRLAADMVPNHMGIYSRWVIEHPDWFISLDEPPYPQYTFNGENLSHDPRVGIYLEDHYYDQSDAAVVFRRTDHQTNQTTYIYHGNDGTAMPWNDTAQLNFLKPEVREAVIQTILHVARQFPIIRFDAAMTLAKKHYQRLWFPQPGTGGAIPSRARFSLTREQFDQAMPKEFWREVVDRVAQEVPDTLLLAEAFWMMEGYFVRTLGMHRVYNSAFMHMLRDEKNARFRKLLKETLEFDPQILKRYVNFMNNPDEETAIEQFGDGGKYFGVCALMATLPGLPMFGHGQIEGYREKYGMEYRRPQWEEYPDPRLVSRHEREIFPLLRRRRQFAEVGNFRLFDFFTASGRVDENVIAYSNNVDGQRSLVAYHNRWANTRGWIRLSAAYRPAADEPLQQTTLAAALGLSDRADHYTLFRDHISGLEYIRNNAELHQRGLYLELGAYTLYVFLDFREVQEAPNGPYAQLCAELDGRGVPSLAEALQERLLEAVLTPWRELVDAELFTQLLTCPPAERRLYRQEIHQKLTRLLEAAAALTQVEHDPASAVKAALQGLNALWDLLPLAGEFDSLAGSLPTPEEDPAFWEALLGWLFTAPLESVVSITPRRLLDEWLLGKAFAEALAPTAPPAQIEQARLALAALLAAPEWWVQPQAALTAWFSDPAVQRLLGVNTYRGVRYFHKESFQSLLRWALAAAAIGVFAAPRRHRATKRKQFAAAQEQIAAWEAAAEACGFQVAALLAGVA